MLGFPYHTRYELIEFAVFTLAARARGLIPLHGACVGSGRRGLILMGASGSGKSTVSLQCLLNGFDFVSEDSTFVMPEQLLCTGIPNFVHVRPDSLRWIEKRDATIICKSPVISRRSGVRKFEVDLREGRYRLAPAAVQLEAVIFLSTARAAGGPLLQRLPRRQTLKRLAVEQPYAANQPGWAGFCRKVSQQGAFELRRGRHPREAVAALHDFLRHGAP
jgi:energy-coupling factor transporter ATP-binding protein EcfA2